MLWGLRWRVKRVVIEDFILTPPAVLTLFILWAVPEKACVLMSRAWRGRWWRVTEIKTRKSGGWGEVFEFYSHQNANLWKTSAEQRWCLVGTFRFPLWLLHRELAEESSSTRVYWKAWETMQTWSFSLSQRVSFWVLDLLPPFSADSEECLSKAQMSAETDTQISITGMKIGSPRTKNGRIQSSCWLNRVTIRQGVCSAPKELFQSS